MPRSGGSRKAGACASLCRPSPTPTWRTCWSGAMAITGEIKMTPPDVSGSARVREIVEAGEELRPEAPRPLMRELPPADPFPVDALGEVLAPAARAVNDRVQAPLAICGQSVLAAANLATQAHVNVVLPIGT